MGRPKGAAKEVGKVLVSVGGWTDQHRKWAKEFAATVGGDERPEHKGLVNGPRPPDIEARIGRLRAEFAANAPDQEPIACWGGCGREIPNGCRPSAKRRKHNRPQWHSRTIVTAPGTRDIEVYCPDCFKAVGGFHGPQEGQGMAAKEVTTGRAAVLDCDDTAKYPRLRDNHVTVGCHDCETTLLADKHAAEVAADPEGLPPLAAGSITLAGRTMRFCRKCIETRVVKLKEDA